MSAAAYHQAIALLKEHRLTPVPVKIPTAEDVARLEARLGVTMPGSYRAMLLEFGLLQVERLDFAGLGNAGLDGTTASSVVFATERYRTDGLMSATMIQIGVSGSGPFYFIDCAALDEHGETPVWEAPGSGVTDGRDKLADSFGDFLLGEVRNLIADIEGDAEEPSGL